MQRSLKKRKSDKKNQNFLQTDFPESGRRIFNRYDPSNLQNSKLALDKEGYTCFPPIKRDHSMQYKMHR